MSNSPPMRSSEPGHRALVAIGRPRAPDRSAWSVKRSDTRNKRDTVLLQRFPASLRLGAFAFSSGAASTQRRQAAKAQRKVFHSGDGFGCGGAHIDYGVGAWCIFVRPQTCSAFFNRRQQRERRKTLPPLPLCPRPLRPDKELMDEPPKHALQRTAAGRRG